MEIEDEPPSPTSSEERENERINLLLNHQKEDFPNSLIKKQEKRTSTPIQKFYRTYKKIYDGLEIQDGSFNINSFGGTVIINSCDLSLNNAILSPSKEIAYLSFSIS